MDEQPRICDVCGQPLSRHPACPNCSVLIGPGHDEETLVSYFREPETRVCGRCNKFARKYGVGLEVVRSGRKLAVLGQ